MTTLQFRHLYLLYQAALLRKYPVQGSIIVDGVTGDTTCHFWPAPMNYTP